MKTQKEIETKIKELMDELDWMYDDSYPYDSWEEVPKIESQIYILNWVLDNKR